MNTRLASSLRGDRRSPWQSPGRLSNSKRPFCAFLSVSEEPAMAKGSSVFQSSNQLFRPKNRPYFLGGFSAPLSFRAAFGNAHQNHRTRTARNPYILLFGKTKNRTQASRPLKSHILEFDSIALRNVSLGQKTARVFRAVFPLPCHSERHPETRTRITELAQRGILAALSSAGPKNRKSSSIKIPIRSDRVTNTF